VQNPATRDSALAYWQGRINQGDNAGLGLARFNDTQAGGGGGSSSSTTTSGGTNVPPPGSPYAHYQPSPQDTQLYNTLMTRAGQSLNVNPNDPIIRDQVDAYGASRTRSARNDLQTMAESNGSYANLTEETRAGNEKAAQDTGSLQATLIQNELNSRRSEIQNALSESGALLTAEQQTALQRELGLIDEQIKSTQVGNQFTLGQGQLALGQQQLGSQNDQFAATYGLNATNQANYWDRVRSGFVPNA
jgi:hypothetical protein